MGFAGFRVGVQAKFNAWGLPNRIVTLFNERIVHDLGGMSLVSLSRGLVWTMSIEDPENAGTHYCFRLRFVINDYGDFWIADIDGFAADKNNHIFWEDRTS